MNEGHIGYEFKCIKCSYALRGVAVDQLCPECGTPVALSLQGGAGGLPSSGKAIASMVLGIVSIMMSCAYGFGIVPGVLAIIFAQLAKAQMARGEVSVNSRGMAVAGLVCGIIGTIFGFFGLGFVVVIFMGVFP